MAETSTLSSGASVGLSCESSSDATSFSVVNVLKWWKYQGLCSGFAMLHGLCWRLAQLSAICLCLACMYSHPDWIAFRTRQFWQISCCRDWLWMFKGVHRNLQVQSTSHEATICCTLCMQIAWLFLLTYLSRPWKIKLLKIHETEPFLGTHTLK